MALLHWIDDGPEPCDACHRPVYRRDRWVAFRDHYANGGVRFECRSCFDDGMRRAELDRQRWEQHRRALT